MFQKRAGKIFVKKYDKRIDTQKKVDIILIVIVIVKQSRISKFRQDWSIRKDDRYQFTVTITSPADFFEGMEQCG